MLEMQETIVYDKRNKAQRMLLCRIPSLRHVVVADIRTDYM